MKIDELNMLLTEIRATHGNIDVVVCNGDDIDYVIVQKYIKTKNPYNSSIIRQTEDMDEYYLEDMYVDGEYKDRFSSKGICVKIV